MRKYFAYAFGEILLVVVGILIALNINNMDMARQQQRELQGFLEKIAKNMEQDINSAAQLGPRRDSITIWGQQAIALLNSDQFDLDIMTKAASCFLEFYFRSNKSGFEALKSSGFIGKIQSPKIDSLLSRYYFIVEGIEEDERSYNNFIEAVEVRWVTSFDATKMFALGSQENFSLEELREFDKIYRPIFQSKDFIAAVGRSAMQDNSQRWYELLIQTGDAFITEVRKD